MKRTIVILICLIMAFVVFPGKTPAQAPKSFSLSEAIDYALENNFSVRSARLDFLIQKKKVKEFLASGFPQISAGLKYSDFIQIPTTLLPDFLTPAVVGINQNLFDLTPKHPVEYSGVMPVQFGIQHNATFDISASQLIFNGSFIVGVQANKKFQQLSEQVLAKTKIDVKDGVAKAYYLVLISEENKRIVDSTLASLRKILSDTREYYKNGFVESTDVDQFELLVSNLEATKESIDKRTDLSYKLLKMQMGYPLDAPIVLSDKLDVFYNDALKMQSQVFDYTGNIDYRILSSQKEIATINLKYEKSRYLPMINGFYSYQQNGMNNTFDFYKFSNDWYPTQVIGIQMSIPLFNSGMKMYRLQQAKFSIDKLDVSLDQVKQGLLIQEESAKTDFQIALLTFQNRQKSMNIAKSIYMKTAVKYKEGVSSSIDLSQTYNQYLTAQTDYINSIMLLLNAKQTLDKIYTQSK